MLSTSSVETEKSLPISQIRRISSNIQDIVQVFSGLIFHIATITYSIHILPEECGGTLPKQLSIAVLKLPTNFHLNEG